jgi:hypothetical protein
MAPSQGHPHIVVNFVQPSPIQQYQNFEQLNTKNPTHQLYNAKKKEKIKTITTQVKVEITPNRTNLLGETRIKGLRIPKGATTKDFQRKITITFEPTSPVPFAVSSVTILIIAPKSLILNR